MYPHRIRLRGPWEYEAPGLLAGRLVLPSAPAEEAPAGRRVDAGGRLTGVVRFRRRFGYPGQIDPHERVWLVAEELPGPARLLVNETELRLHGGAVLAPGSHEFDVTELLRPRNELTIELDLTGTGRLWQEVALEVRCLAYLREVDVAVHGETLSVTGLVVGPPVGPLDLYLIVDRSPAGYRSITPTPGGERFELTTAVQPGGEVVREVTIELVRGACVWYTMRVDLIAQSG